MKYKEIDMSFYGKKEMPFTEIIPNDYGYLLKWDQQEDISGYAIYRNVISKEGWELLVSLDSYVTQYQDSKPPENSLYEYRIYALIEGDFVLGNPDNAGGVDFGLTRDYQSAQQDMTNRIRTQKGDWRSHKNLGANLELLEGEKNTKETGVRGEDAIRDALTYDGRFDTQDITVKAVPVSIEHIDFYSILDSDENEPIIVKNPQSL